MIFRHKYSLLRERLYWNRIQNFAHTVLLSGLFFAAFWRRDFSLPVG